MISRPQFDLPMSFTSATPELLVRFRQKLGDADLSVWQRNTHVLWASEFIDSFAGRTLCSISYEEVQRFLNRIELRHQLNGEKRKEVLATLSFLYHEIDGVEPPWGAQQITKRQRQVKHYIGLSRNTIKTVLPLVEYQCQLPVALIYAAGLKPSECAALRIDDLLLDQNKIQVRNKEGEVTHLTVLPKVMRSALVKHLEQRRQTHMKDNTVNFAGAPVPMALAKGTEPYARRWRCQFLFADGQLSHLGDGRMIRRDIGVRRIERSIRMAADRVELGETVTAQSLRLSFAKHLMQQAADPIVLQYVLGQLPKLPDEYHQAFEQLSSPIDELWPDGRTPWRQ